MPPVDDEPFRAHADQPARPTTVTQRLTFQGLSQETPPAAGNEALDKPTNVFSPGTIRKTVREGFTAPEKTVGEAGLAPPEVKTKKQHRKRKPGAASSSQPPPMIRGREELVPPRPDGLAHRLHEAGKPILPPEMLCFAYGHMHSLQDRKSVV